MFYQSTKTWGVAGCFYSKKTCAASFLKNFKNIPHKACLLGVQTKVHNFPQVCGIVFAHGLWLTLSCGHLSDWLTHLNMSTDSGQQWQWKTTRFPMNHPLSDQLKPWFNLWDLNWFNIHRKAFTKNPIRLYMKWLIPWNTVI